MDIKKIYIIGAGSGKASIEKVKRDLKLKEDIKIILVESMEEIPLEDRLNSNPSIIQQIHKFSAHPILRPITYYNDNKKRKGHERPYKYHR
jgi:hypothetical protein